MKDGVCADLIAEKPCISDGRLYRAAGSLHDPSRPGMGPSGHPLYQRTGTKLGGGSLLHEEIHGLNAANGISVGGYVTPIAEPVMTLDLNESSG